MSALQPFLALRILRRVMAVTLGINLEKTPSYWIPFWDTHEEITGAPCDAARPLWRRLALLSPLESSTGCLDGFSDRLAFRV